MIASKAESSPPKGSANKWLFSAGGHRKLPFRRYWQRRVVQNEQRRGRGTASCRCFPGRDRARCPGVPVTGTLVLISAPRPWSQICTRPGNRAPVGVVPKFDHASGRVDRARPFLAAWNDSAPAKSWSQTGTLSTRPYEAPHSPPLGTGGGSGRQAVRIGTVVFPAAGPDGFGRPDRRLQPNGVKPEENLRTT